MIRIRLNGEERRVSEGETVTELLAALAKDPRTVAVELNGRIVPRDTFAGHRLADGDRLEIVEFVQGGSGV